MTPLLNYANTVIYKIVSNDISITECYVGSTTDFVSRKVSHKNACANEKGIMYNRKVYRTIRDNGGWAEWSIIELEKYPCKDSNEARLKEREWFERLNSSLNTNYPQRSRKEHLIQYGVDHKDEIAFYQKQYNKDHQDEIALYQKQYRKDHQDEIALHRKQNYEKNKKDMYRPFICQCGKKTSPDHNNRHSKSVEHIKYMTTIGLSSDPTVPIITI